MKKISVIIPVYKVEKYIHRCVKSVINQTYKNLEILLVDDGSPDSCPQICDEYAKIDNRVKVIHQCNQGVSAARNMGLKAAVGDYITFIDSDDYIDSNMYQEMMNIVEKFNAEVVMCDCVKEFCNHQEVYTHNIRSGYYDLEQLRNEYYPHLLMMENLEYPPTISNCLLLFKNKKDCGIHLHYESGIRFSEDLLFGAQLMRQANSFYYMKEQCFYHYCMNEESASHTFVPDKWEDYIRLYVKIKESFLDDQIYNFNIQIDLCLLFFVLNTIADLYGANIINHNEKVKKVESILQTSEVREMMKRLSISSLFIPVKLKIIIFLYKYNFAIDEVCSYYERKNR